MEHRKPKTVSRKLDPEKQASFIKAYEDLLNQMDADEVERFADAVHSTHAMQPVGCWAPKDTPIAVAQAQGPALEHPRRDRPGDRPPRGETVDAASLTGGIELIALLAGYPRKRVISPVSGQRQVPSREAGAGLAGAAGLQDQAHSIPTYSAYLDPIERLWGLMHRHITHNKCHETFRDFRDAILTFLREEVPRNWPFYRDEVTDNIRIISPTGFGFWHERSIRSFRQLRHYGGHIPFVWR